MQTFVPWPDAAESARSLDRARLGKQRVEALQVLRAITLPTYGWQSHPAIAMWRGYRPALAAYSLAVTDEWIAQGHADTVRPQIAEFAPGVEADTAGLELPTWWGDEAVHLSHRSKLVQKDPEHYRGVFPGTPEDLDYAWPPADPAAPRPTDDDALDVEHAWVVRAPSAAAREGWLASGVVTVGESSPRGRTGTAWQHQLEAFGALPVGAGLLVPDADGSAFVRGTVTSPVVAALDDDRAPVLLRHVELDGELLRSDLPDAALAQDPRSVFPLALGPRPASDAGERRARPGR